MSTLVLTVSMNTFAVLISVPCVAAGYPVAAGLPASWLYIFPFLMTVISGTAVMCALSRAFQIGPPSKVTAICMTGTLLAAAIGVFGLSEKMTWISVIGAATIMLSVLLVQTPSSAKSAKDPYQAVDTEEPKETVEMSIQPRI